MKINKKILLFILAALLVASSVIVSIVLIQTNAKEDSPNDSDDITSEVPITTEQEMEEETTEETTRPPQTEPETTASPVTEDVSVTDPPAPPPPPSGGHKSANFGNVLFIGDSRTVGLKDYANLGAATVFAENGLNVFRLFKDAVNVPGKGSVTLENLLLANQYDKIYIMLGINEIGYNLDKVIEKFGQALDTLQSYQPSTTIYIQANLMIQKSRSDRDAVYNNANMQYLNDHMASFADGEKRIFIDVNPLFSDGAGNLAPEYAYDDFHLIGAYYAVWADWIYETTCE